MKKVKIILKLILILLLAVNFSEIQLISDIADAQELPFTGKSLSSFILPEDLGYVDDSWIVPSGKKTIFHIQDAHCNYFAQKKIESIISYLNKEYGVTSVNLEGGTGLYDLSEFRNIGDKTVREKVSDYFMMEGILSGAEYFSVNNDWKVNLWGVEEIGLYKKNLEIFRAAISSERSNSLLLAEFLDIVTRLKKNVYSTQLLELDSIKELYSSGSVPINEYLDSLFAIDSKDLIDIKSYPMIGLLKESQDMQMNIDFNKAENERDDLINEIQRDISKSEQVQLFDKIKNFSNGEMPELQFYTYLFKTAKLLNLSGERFSNFFLFYRYLELYSTIDEEKLIEEIDTAYDKKFLSRAKNDDEKKLYCFIKKLKLLEKLIDFRVLRGEYDEIVFAGEEFISSDDINRIEEMCARNKISHECLNNIRELRSIQENIVGFFEYSFKRDEMFIKNIFSKDSPGHYDKSTILITGGFHSKNLKKLLKDQNISYISIVPRFREEKEYVNPYFKLLAGENVFSGPEIQPGNLALFSEFCTGAEDIYGPDHLKAARAWIEITRAFFSGNTRVEVGNKVYSVKPLRNSVQIKGLYFSGKQVYVREINKKNTIANKAKTVSVINRILSGFKNLKDIPIFNIPWKTRKVFLRVGMPGLGFKLSPRSIKFRRPLIEKAIPAFSYLFDDTEDIVEFKDILKEFDDRIVFPCYGRTFVGDTIPAFRHLINNMDDLYTVANNLYTCFRMSKSKNKQNILVDALSGVGHLARDPERDIKKLWDMIENISLEEKRAGVYPLLESGIRSIGPLVESMDDLEDKVKDLFSLEEYISGDVLWLVYRSGIREAFDVFDGDPVFRWDNFIRMAKDARNASGDLFSWGLRHIRELYPNKKMFIKKWPLWRGRIYRLISATNKFNRKKIFGTLFRHPDYLQDIAKKITEDQIESHMDFYVGIIEKYPDLAAITIEEIIKGIKNKALTVELSYQERTDILKLLESNNAFDPVLYELVKREGDPGIDDFNKTSGEMLLDEYDPERIKDLKEEFGRKGYDGKIMTMAAVNRMMPLNGFSFWKKKRLLKDFETIAGAKDRKNDIPEVFKGKDENGRERSIVYEADLENIEYKLKAGQESDRDNEIINMVNALTSQPAGIIETREKLVKSIIRYLEERTDIAKEEAIISFYEYASNNAEVVEPVSRIGSLNYKALKTLEELFTEDAGLPDVLRRVLYHHVPNSLFRKKGSRKITNASKLLKVLRKTWENLELSTQKRKEILANQLKTYAYEEINKELFSRMDEEDPLYAIMKNITDRGLEIDLSIPNIVNDIFQVPLEIIRSEIGRYEPVETVDKSKLEFKIVKSAPFRLWWGNAGVCIGRDDGLWNNKNFYLMAIIDRQKNNVVGFVHLFEEIISGERVLTVPGINPSVEFLSKVKPRDLMPKIIKAIQKTAIASGCNKIYLPTMENKGNILSNRSDIVDFIEKKKYKKVILNKPVFWNQKPDPYPFDRVYDLPFEKGPDPVGAISGGRTTERESIIEDIMKDHRPLTADEQEIIKKRLRILYNRIHRAKDIEGLIKARIKSRINYFIRAIRNKKIVVYSPDVGIRSDSQYVLACAFKDNNGDNKIALVEGILSDKKLSVSGFQQEILLHEILALIYPEISHFDHKSRYRRDIYKKTGAVNFTMSLAGIQRKVFGHENILGEELRSYVKNKSEESVIKKYERSIGKVSKTSWDELSEKQKTHYLGLGRILQKNKEKSGFMTEEVVDIEPLLFQLDMISMKMMGEFDEAEKETDLEALNQEKRDMIELLGKSIGKDEALFKAAISNIKKYFIEVRKKTQETFHNKQSEIASQFVKERSRIIREEEAVRRMAVSEQLKLAEDRAEKERAKKEKEVLDKIRDQYGQLGRFKSMKEKIINNAQQRAIKQGAGDIVESGFKKERILLREKVELAYQKIEDNKEKLLEDIKQEYEKNRTDPFFYFKILVKEREALKHKREEAYEIARKENTKRVARLRRLEPEILRSISGLFYGRVDSDRGAYNIIFNREQIIKDVAGKVNGRNNIVKVLVGVPSGIENKREFKKLKDQIEGLLKDLLGNNDRKQVYFYRIGSNIKETKEDYRTKLNKLKRIVGELPDEDREKAQIVSFEYRDDLKKGLLPEKEYQYSGVKKPKQVIVLADSYSDLFYPDIFSRVLLAKLVGFYANCPAENKAGRKQTMISINRLLSQVLQGFKPIEDIKYLFKQVLQFKTLPLKDIEHWRVFSKAVGVSL